MPLRPIAGIAEHPLNDIPKFWLSINVRTIDQEFGAIRHSNAEPWIRIVHPFKEVELASMEGLCSNVLSRVDK